MHRTIVIAMLGVVTVCSAPRVAAQTQNVDSIMVVRADDALARIRRYASTDVVVARTLADSLVTALPASSRLLPDALFAKASIAASAAEAERDYTRIVTEHRFAARVPDALMRLALLESARNNRTSALRHLDRLLRDHADSPARARASLLAGRLRMEANDPARACELLAAAYASANANERDVKDQAEQLGARCPEAVSVMASGAVAPMGVKRAPGSTAVPTTPAATRATPPAQRPKRDSLATVVRSPAPSVRPRDSVVAPRVIVRDTTATVVTPPPGPRPEAVSVPRNTSVPASTSGERFGVQFAAYNDRPGAEEFASVLRGRGITARVEGTSKPFRVRAGRYTTREEAEAAAALWRRPGQAAMVVSLGAQP
jgi:cell division protein FtsN